MGSSFRRFTRHVVVGWSVAHPITYFVIMHCSLVSLVFLAASCFTAPLEDTPEVVEARANFHKVFDLAEAGLLGQFAPVNNDIQAAPIPAAYIADTEDVAMARASFKATFADVEAGGLAALQAPAPVHVVPEAMTLSAEPVAAAAAVVDEPAAAVVEAAEAAPVAPALPLSYAAYPWMPYTVYPFSVHHPYSYSFPTVAAAWPYFPVVLPGQVMPVAAPAAAAESVDAEVQAPAVESA